MSAQFPMWVVPRLQRVYPQQAASQRVWLQGQVLVGAPGRLRLGIQWERLQGQT